MKILFISHSSEIGGAEKNLWRLLKGLPKEEFDCYCVFPKQGPLEKMIKELGIKTFISGLKWWVNDREALVNFFEFCNGLNDRVKKLIDIIKSQKIDLVMTNTVVIGEGAIAARMAGVPHVFRIAELLKSDPALKPPLDLRTFYNIVYSLSDGIIVVAKAVKAEIERTLGFQSAKIKVVYDGVDLNECRVKSFEPRNGKNKIVLTAAVVSRRKGITTLLNAAHYVNLAIPNVTFLIAGIVSENKYYKALLKRRRELGLVDKFRFLGFRDDIYKLMYESDLLVLPSISEPFGMVLLEAMCLRKPVVATRSGGPEEGVVDGKTGFLVPVEDEKAMADKIIYLLKNDEIATRMGEAGYERALQNFSIENYIKDIASVLRAAFNIKGSESKYHSGYVVDILTSIGSEKDKFKTIYTSYNQLHNSLIFKAYKRLGLFKTLIRHMLVKE